MVGSVSFGYYNDNNKIIIIIFDTLLNSTIKHLFHSLNVTKFVQKQVLVLSQLMNQIKFIIYNLKKQFQAIFKI